MRPSDASNQPGSRVGASDITRRSANPVGAPAITPPSEACVTTGVILQNAALCYFAKRFTQERLCL